MRDEMPARAHWSALEPVRRGRGPFARHPGGTIFGAILGTLVGASIGADVDRAEAYRNSYYYGGRIYYYPPPPPPPGIRETRTVYRNPDGSTTTYIGAISLAPHCEHIPTDQQIIARIRVAKHIGWVEQAQ